LQLEQQKQMPRPTRLRDTASKFRRVLAARHGTKGGEPETDPDVLLQPDEAYAEIIGAPFDSTDFDFRHPDYSPIFQRRAESLAILQERPGLLVPVKKYYAEHPADFITDWANTFNPLNPGQGLPTTLPFVLFERQREWIDYVIRKWHARERGLTEKSREVGMSWLAIGLSCTMCLFNREFVVGFGSYKKEYVDEAGDPKSLFWKARFFIEHLPAEFRGSWEKSRHAPQFRIFFPDSGSVIFGDVGDELGRGGRSALFFVDEAARLAHPELVEASLLRKWHARERGLTEKSREVGMSWLALGLSCTMCLFNREFVVGFGSYKKEYVDEAGDPKSLFWKARFFIEHLPAEFRGSWEKSRHAPQFRIFFPDSGSVAARLAHPELVEASLSFTTNCRMDISTPNGLATTFYQNRNSGRSKSRQSSRKRFLLTHRRPNKFSNHISPHDYLLFPVPAPRSTI
jgi:hypothetical protein